MANTIFGRKRGLTYAFSEFIKWKTFEEELLNFIWYYVLSSSGSFLRMILSIQVAL